MELSVGISTTSITDKQHYFIPVGSDFLAFKQFDDTHIKKRIFSLYLEPIWPQIIARR
jgi:hypothetical protein